MKKQFIAAILASATALSMSTSAFAAPSPTDKTYSSSVGVQMPVLTITWPTAVGVVLNPYNLTLTVAASAGKNNAPATGTGKVDLKNGTDAAIVSNDLTITNGSDCAIMVNVTGSVKPMMQQQGEMEDKENPGTMIPAVDAKGNPIMETVEDTSKDKIVFSKAALKGTETTNTVFLYLEQGTIEEETDEKGKVTQKTVWKDTFSATDKQQYLLDVVAAGKTAPSKSFTIEKKSAKGATKSPFAIRGDMSKKPTKSWAQVAKDGKSIAVDLVFAAEPVATEKTATP